MTRIAWFTPSGVARDSSEMHIPVLAHFARKCAEKVSLTVFSFSSYSTVRFSLIDGIQIYYLPVSWDAPFWKRALVLSSHFLREHRNTRFHAIHGFWALPCGLLAVLLGRIYGIRSVVTFPGGETANLKDIHYGNMRSWLSRMLTLWVARNTSVLHLLTEFQRSGLHAIGSGQSRCIVVPFGIDRSAFRSLRARRMSSPFRILHVANLTEVKDQVTLLRAFESISKNLPAVLRIIGPDFLNGSLQETVRTMNLQRMVEFLGFVPHSSIGDHYSWADVYMHSSRHEGQGMSVMEAMAAGVPVCGTRVGILWDLPPGVCESTDPGDPLQLAKAAMSILKSPNRRKALQKRALEWSASHDADFTARKLLEVYRYEDDRQ